MLCTHSSQHRTTSLMFANCARPYVWSCTLLRFCNTDPVTAHIFFEPGFGYLATPLSGLSLIAAPSRAHRFRALSTGRDNVSQLRRVRPSRRVGGAHCHALHLQPAPATAHNTHRPHNQSVLLKCALSSQHVANSCVAKAYVASYRALSPHPWMCSRLCTAR